MNRITPADIEANIAAEYSFTADKALGEGVPLVPTLSLLTICILVLRNGFKVVGTSACVDPAIFDAEIGRRLAREDALRQVWPLMGYELATRMHKRSQHDCSPSHSEAARQDVKALGGCAETRITFEALIEWAKGLPGVNIVNGMPSSFTYQGLAVTHERDDCYIVDGLPIRPGDELVIPVDGPAWVDDHLPF